MNAASNVLCPALFLAASASGQGKTTITAAVARFHQRQGRVVRVFKTDLDGERFELLGLLEGEGAMRAHAHHRSRSEVKLDPIAHGRRQRHPAPGEAIYRSNGLTTTYLHLFFASNPTAVAALFRG